MLIDSTSVIKVPGRKDPVDSVVEVVLVTRIPSFKASVSREDRPV